MTTPTPEPQRAGGYGHLSGDYGRLQDMTTKRGIYTERHIGVLVGTILQHEMGEHYTPENLYVLFCIASLYDQSIIRQPGEHGDQHKQRKLDALAKAGEIAIKDGGMAWTVRAEHDGHSTDWVVEDIIRDWTVNISLLASKASRRKAD